MNKENYFISRFTSIKIGDDGAVVGDFVYSKDAFFENVHFKTKWMNYFQVARKAMLVNVSDAIAMNAKPKYALLSVAMPKTISKQQMISLVEGFESVCSEYNIEIIGGDTLSNSKLDITVTIISTTKKPLYRTGLRKGDLLAYSGELGESRKDLKSLFRGVSLHSRRKFFNVELRASFIKSSRRLLHCGMDISDGLGSDLEKLLSVNRLGVKFLKSISKDIMCSGEEYEMLVGFSPRERRALLRRAQASRTKLNIIGVATRSRYANMCKAHHF